MKTIKVSCLLIFTLSLLFVNLSEANHGKNLPSAVVVGTVYCDTCFQKDFSRTSHFISGASVAVNCANRNLKTSFYEEVKTNEHGVFEVNLPTAVSKDLKSIKECSVRLIDSSEPFCAVASSATSSSLHLKERKEGTHIFSAGVFSFKPLKQPEFCYLKPTDVPNSKEFSSNNALSLPALPALPVLPATIKRKATEISNRNSFSAEKELVPTLPTLPTLPTQPTLPTLPTLPTQPTLPTLPVPSLPLPTIPLLPPLQTLPKMRSPLSDQKVSVLPPLVPPVLPTPSPTIGGIPLPPNPLEPAPLLPNPLQPTPPSTGLPGIPSLPPLPTLPIPPGLPGTPSLPIPPSTGLPGIPSLPPLPTLPIPIPPSTGLPGIPSLPPLPTLPIPPSTGLPGIPSLPPLPALPTPPSPGFPSIPTATKKTTP